jgi:hypothetical protein
MDSLRHNADSNVKYMLYFDLLHAKMKQYNIQPCYCYNIDEKGFMIGVTGCSKQVFTQWQWEKKEVRASLQDGSHEWLTLLATVCTDVSTLPPVLIFQVSSGSLQSSWVGPTLKQESTTSLSPHLHLVGQTTTLVWHGWSRFLTAAQMRKRSEKETGVFLYLTAMAVTLHRILSTTATPIVYSLLYFRLTVLICVRG